MAGCYFSINGAMLGSDKGRALVRSLPKDRLLTETDSPFTSLPGRNSLPWDVIGTADRLSVELDVGVDVMQALLRERTARTCCNSRA